MHGHDARAIGEDDVNVVLDDDGGDPLRAHHVADDVHDGRLLALAHPAPGCRSISRGLSDVNGLMDSDSSSGMTFVLRAVYRFNKSDPTLVADCHASSHQLPANAPEHSASSATARSSHRGGMIVVVRAIAMSRFSEMRR